MHKKYKKDKYKCTNIQNRQKIQNLKKKHKSQKVQSTKKSLGRYLLVQKRKLGKRQKARN